MNREVTTKPNESVMNISDRIKVWREEREKRLLDRLFKGRKIPSEHGNRSISAAVLGIKSCSTNLTGNQSCKRLSLKSRKSSTSENKAINNKLQLNHRYSCINLNQRRSKMGIQNVNRKSLVKFSKNDKKNVNEIKYKPITKIMNRSSSNKLPDKIICENESTNVVKKEEVCLPTYFEDKKADAEFDPESSTNKKLNSTFTLDDNLPSPIEKVEDTTSKVLPKQKNKLQPILKPVSKHLKSTDLSQRLSEWASTTGKSHNYRHLQCFVSNIPPKVCRTPLTTVRKVQFKLNGRKSLLTPKNVNRSVKFNKPVEITRVIDDKLPEITSESVLVDEQKKVFERNLTFDNGPTASTPEKETIHLESQDTNLPIFGHPPETEQDLKLMTISALEDLLSLIRANYSLKACEEWLLAIRQRNLSVDEIPLYWLCLAAFEEAKGNIFLALDSYQKAVEQGAEVQLIETCVDKMYDKFKALNIEIKKDKENIPSDRDKKAVINSVKKKEIFKSTVIAFARYQKIVKQLDPGAETYDKSVKYFVTPVRRSTRKSSVIEKSPFISDNVNDVLTNDENSQTQFKTNRALLNYSMKLS